MITVLIPDAESVFVGPVVQCLARRSDVRLHLASHERWPPQRFSRHCTAFHRVPRKERAHPRALLAVLRRQPIDVLLPVSEEGFAFVQQHRDLFETRAALPPLPQLSTLELAGDKARLAEALDGWGLPTPRTTRCTRDEAFERFLESTAFPVLVKAVRAGNGQHIYRLESRDALHSFLEKHPEIQADYIVQELVPGIDVSVNVLARDGRLLAHAINECRLPNPRRYGPPLGIEFLEDPECFGIVEDLIERLHWSGPADVDFIRSSTTGRCLVLEINTRFWSSLLADEAAGINFPYLACLTALGRPFETPKCRPITYLPAGASLGHAARGLFTPPEARFPIPARELAHLLSDPVPTAVHSLQKRWARGKV